MQNLRRLHDSALLAMTIKTILVRGLKGFSYLLKLLLFGLSKIILVLFAALKKVMFFSIRQIKKIWRSNFIKNPNNTKNGIVSFCIVIFIVATVIVVFFVFDSGSEYQYEDTANLSQKDVSLEDLNYALEDVGNLFNSISKTAANWSNEVQIAENCIRKLNRCRDNADTTTDLKICQEEYNKCLL